ncbi:MAG TPA: hypothetical protein RMH99_01445 [Sandaracinaceae bacterium LLY-WYZ-13_1]|nr:hypothetical protein [Sandaracinaceae bacterium LLY-WYZ-13_1]
MTDPLCRRGFTRAALAGAAALWLPAVGRADEPSDLALDVRVAALGERSRLEVVLFARSSGSRGVEVPANGLRLTGHLARDGAARPLALEPKRRPAPMPRTGPRVTRRILVPAEGEARLGAYAARLEAPWPGAICRVAIATRRLGGATGEDRAALAALDGRTASCRVRWRG